MYIEHILALELLINLLGMNKLHMVFGIVP